MKLKLICTALSIAILCAGCGSAPSGSAEPTASPEPTSAIVSSTFKEASLYDYKDYTDSQNIDETGFFTGVRALDYVTLPEDYKAIPASKADLTPSDDIIKVGMDSIVSQYTAAALGDTVNIDYVGTVDGVEFMGGNTNGMGSDLTLGSGQFIPGFEDQIVGHKVGDTFDITVTFPEGYRDSTDASGNTIVLANTEAVFSVTINHISFGWELTDAWVKQNLEKSTYEVSTVEQLKNYVSNMVAQNIKENYALDYLVKHCTYGETAPEPVLDYMVCRYLSSLNQYAEYADQDLETFLKARDFSSIDELLAYNEEAILNAVQTQLAVQAVAEAADIKLDTNLVAQYDSYVENYGQPYVNQYVMNRQVLKLLTDGLVIS